VQKRQDELDTSPLMKNGVVQQAANELEGQDYCTAGLKQGGPLPSLANKSAKVVQGRPLAYVGLTRGVMGTINCDVRTSANWLLALNRLCRLKQKTFGWVDGRCADARRKPAVCATSAQSRWEKFLNVHKQRKRQSQSLPTSFKVRVGKPAIRDDQQNEVTTPTPPPVL
jgi:hypothetical protein